MFTIPANAIAGGVGQVGRSANLTSGGINMGGVKLKEGRRDTSLSKVTGVLPILYDLCNGKNVDTGYVDTYEEMLGGELLIRPLFKYGVRLHDSTDNIVNSSRGSILVKVSKYCDNHGARIHRIRLGNFNTASGCNKVVAFDSFVDYYGDDGKMAVIAKNVSGINHKIFSNKGVFDRWIGPGYDIKLVDFEATLNEPDDRALARRDGIHLRQFECDTETIGKWVLSCMRVRFERRGSDAKSINLRLLYELLVHLVTEDEDQIFNDILVHGESWLCGDGCDSCLRGVLRRVDVIRRTAIQYPFSYWEHRSNERSITVKSSTFKWVYEPHENAITVGKIVSWIGPHDFLVLDNSAKYVEMCIRDGENEEMILIESICFSSLGFLLDGIFHHIRSLCLADSDEGLLQWFNFYNNTIDNFNRLLLEYYCKLGYLQGLNNSLTSVIAHLRIWMLTGKINRKILTMLKGSMRQQDGSNNMFQNLVMSLLTTKLSVALKYEYNRVESNVSRSSIGFKFFNIA